MVLKELESSRPECPSKMKMHREVLFLFWNVRLRNHAFRGNLPEGAFRQVTYMALQKHRRNDGIFDFSNFF